MTKNRILVVEDDEISRLCLVALLRRLDVYSEEANSGQQALQLLEARSYNLILMDLQLPDMSGEEVLRRLSSSPNPQRSPLAIAVTTQVDENQTWHLRKAGFAGHLLKPVSGDTLKLIIDCWLGAPEKIEELTRKITNHLDNRQEMAAVLLEKFLRDLEPQLLQIEKAILEGNRDNAATLVHKLNGGAGFIGLVELQQLANTMETSLKDPRQVDPGYAWHQLKNEAQRLMALGPRLLNQLTQEASLNLSNKV